MRSGIVCVFSVLMFFGLACNAKEVSFRADYWYPYNGEPASLKPGYMIEIAELALEEAGVVVDYQLMPWGAAINSAVGGSIDCIVGPTKEEAPSLLFTKQNLGIAHTGFYARFGELDNWKYNGVKSLENFRVGVTEAVVYVEDYEVIRYLADVKNKNVYIAKGDQPLIDLIGSLAKGEIDIIIETAAVFKAASKDGGVSLLFSEVDHLTIDNEVYIACSQENSESQRYLDLIDKKIDQMRKNGDFVKLLNKYGIKDWH